MVKMPSEETRKKLQEALWRKALTLSEDTHRSQWAEYLRSFLAELEENEEDWPFHDRFAYNIAIMNVAHILRRSADGFETWAKEGRFALLKDEEIKELFRALKRVAQELLTVDARITEECEKRSIKEFKRKARKRLASTQPYLT